MRSGVGQNTRSLEAETSYLQIYVNKKPIAVFLPCSVPDWLCLPACSGVSANAPLLEFGFAVGISLTELHSLEIPTVTAGHAGAGNSIRRTC